VNPEANIACRGRINVIQEHKVMQGIGKHCKGIQDGKKPDNVFGSRGIKKPVLGKI
jgi:hypothetical protein